MWNRKYWQSHFDVHLYTSVEATRSSRAQCDPVGHSTGDDSNTCAFVTKATPRELYIAFIYTIYTSIHIGKCAAASLWWIPYGMRRARSAPLKLARRN